MQFFQIRASLLLTCIYSFWTLHYNSVRGISSHNKLKHKHLCCKTAMQRYCGLTGWTGNHRRTRRGTVELLPPLAWKFSGQTMFWGQAEVVQKSWIIKNIYSIQWIQGTLCFSRQAQVAQKSWTVKTFSIQCIQCISIGVDPRILGYCSE